MKKGKGADGNAAELRRRAEQRLRERTSSAPPPSAHDAAKQLHELQVHRIELEMQNEELITSRAQAEAALERYAELYDFAPVGYFTLGRDGTIGQVNLEGARLLGEVRSVILRKRFGAFVAPADLPAYNTLLENSLAGHATQSGEIALRPSSDPPGEAVHVQLSLSVSANGEECRAVVTDVTERRKAEERLRSLQKMEAIRRLAGGVAHEFNNLLTIVLTNAELALESTGDSESIREGLTDLKSAADRAASITRQLLAFGRGGQVPTRERVDVDARLTDLESMLRRLLGAQVELVLELHAGTRRVAIDPAQLESAIVTLVLRRRDAMPTGGRLTIATEPLDVVESTATRYPMRRSGAFVTITVRDTGPAMSPAAIEGAFEPFWPQEGGRKSGVGLELPTVQSIVHQCGGEIAVHSEPDTGTTFEIYLPQAAASVRPGRRAAVGGTRAGGGPETILVVEDEDSLRRAAKRILVSLGYTVLVADGGVDALRVCAEYPGEIHLALSDVLMPGMTGLELAERLKSVRPKTRILHMSGYVEDALDPRIRRTNYIGKPFTIEALHDKVREVLDAPAEG